MVNAGDNTVSSFRVTASGLKLADRVSSGGVLPISLTSSGHLLYVLNELSGNIFRPARFAKRPSHPDH